MFYLWIHPVKISLHKWYLDVVSDDGRVGIGYAASLKVGFLPMIRWSSRFLSENGGVTNEVQRWRKVCFPKRISAGWQWTSPARESGIWSDGHPGRSVPLALEDGVEIIWTCLAAKSNCSLNGREEGNGYVEKIQIELGSPRLPFKDLWWGRAHAGTESLVWIQWARGRDRCWLLRNGQLVDGRLSSHKDGSVQAVIGNEVWKVEPVRVLRERNLMRALPRWIVAMGGELPFARERKFLGSATCEIDGSSRSMGSAIGEIVQWR
jgi:hypothetical protein